MSFFCRIFVDHREIYSGELAEFPEEHKNALIDDLSNWTGHLSKGGLNELLYSRLSWYIVGNGTCTSCNFSGRGYEDGCPKCGGALEKTYDFERDDKLDLIVACVGVVTHIELGR